MGAAVEFEWDSRDLDVWRGGKVTKEINKRLRLAGNAAIREMKPITAAAISRKKRVRAEDLRRGLTPALPHPAAELSELEWRLWVSGRPVPLASFPHIDTRQGAGKRGSGVLVTVNVGKGATRVAHAFVATMRSGHEGIFVRRGRAHLPINELFTSRLSDTLRDPGLAVTIEGYGYRKLATAFGKSLPTLAGALRKKGLA